MLLSEHLERLAAFQPTSFPFISLYLNTQADQHGRDHFNTFVRKELKARAKTYPPNSPERESFERDTERIRVFLRDELRPSSNGAALFACSGGGDFFDVVQTEAPIEQNRLYVYNQPHLYDLARLDDQYPRYLALVADTNSARIFVFGLSTTLEKTDVTSPKVSHTTVGGWSQARYQRHSENFYLHHAKEVVDEVDRITRQEGIRHVVVAGDEVIIPLLRQQFPRHLEEKVVDVLRLDIRTPEHQILETSLQAMRDWDDKNDAGKVDRMINQFRAGGLGVAGPAQTLDALEKGQVDELLLTANVRELQIEEEEKAIPAAGVAVSSEQAAEVEPARSILADSLVTRAQQTGAKVTFIENPALLAGVGGAGALLRFRI